MFERPSLVTLLDVEADPVAAEVFSLSKFLAASTVARALCDPVSSVDEGPAVLFC